jgi:hypothetical protein
MTSKPTAAGDVWDNRTVAICSAHGVYTTANCPECAVERELARTRVVRPVDELRVRQLIHEELHKALSVQRPNSPHGCICPPTSEQTCEGPLCPRKRTGEQG